jgi:hypothetical protein
VPLWGSLADLMQRIFEACSSLNGVHLVSPKEYRCADESGHGTPRPGAASEFLRT